MSVRSSSSPPDTSWHLPLLDVIEKGLDLLKKTAATPGIAESSAAAAFLAGPWATAIVLPFIIGLRFHAQRAKDKKSSAQLKQARAALIDPVKAAFTMLESDSRELHRIITGEGINTATPLLILFDRLRENGGKLDGLDSHLAAAHASLNDIKATLQRPDYRLGNLETRLRKDFRIGFESLEKNLLIESSNLPAAIRASLNEAFDELLNLGRQTCDNTERLLKYHQLDDASSLLSPASLDAYAAALQLRYRTPELLSIRQTTDAAPFSLTDIFIEPHLRLLFRPDPRALELPEEEQKELQQELDAEGIHFSKKDLESARAAFRGHAPVPAFEHLEDWEMPGQLLFSGAGGGKSALLQYLALRWATAWAKTRDHEQAGPVPLLIELRRYASAFLQDHTLNFEKFVATSQEFPAPLPALAVAAALAEGRVRLLLDGLDEVLDPRLRRDIARLALDHIRKDRPVLLTTRIFGFDPLPWADQPAVEAHLIPAFDEDQRDRFIEKAHRVLAPDSLRRENLDRSLRQRLKTLPHFRELADNPLLLTLLVLVTANHSTIETRADLYEEASKLLLDQWETQRFRQGEFSLPHAIEPLQYSTRRNILGHLAWTQLHRPVNQPVNLFPLADIKQAIRAGAAALSSSSLEYHVVHLPELLRQRHNVLCFRGGEKFSFVHRTFLEYFAAVHLHNLATEAELPAGDVYFENIRPHLRDERWQEPLRLYFSLTDKTKVAKLTTALLAETEPGLKQRDTMDNPAPLLLAAEAFHETRQDTRPAELASQISKNAAWFLSRPHLLNSTVFLSTPHVNSPPCRLVRSLVYLDLFLGDPIERWENSSFGRGSVGGPVVCALRVLGDILHKEQRFGEFLLKLVHDRKENEYLRGQALEILNQQYSERIFPDLLVKIIQEKREDEHVRVLATAIFRRSRLFIPEVREILVDILRDKEDSGNVRASAIWILSDFEWANSVTRGLIVEVLRDSSESHSVRNEAIRTLGKGPSLDSDLREAVITLIRDRGEDVWVRRACVENLCRQLGSNPDSLDLLVEVARDRKDNVNVRGQAAASLGEYYRQNPLVHDLLVEISKAEDENRGLRKNASEWLLK